MPSEQQQLALQTHNSCSAGRHGDCILVTQRLRHTNNTVCRWLTANACLLTSCPASSAGCAHTKHQSAAGQVARASAHKSSAPPVMPASSPDAQQCLPAHQTLSEKRRHAHQTCSSCPGKRIPVTTATPVLSAVSWSKSWLLSKRPTSSAASVSPNNYCTNLSITGQLHTQILDTPVTSAVI
jgi:hypothetical protein